jgi:Fe-Mn family superoxide dismutase
MLILFTFFLKIIKNNMCFSGDLEKALVQNFGSFEEFKKQLAAASIGVQGSGWGWLGFNPQNKKLAVISCPNQDPLFPTTG